MNNTQSIPRFVLVGIPNAGKSSLLNRLTGNRAVIIHDKAHTTRDITLHPVEWAERAAYVQDTPGFTSSPDSEIETEAQAQLKAALHEATAVVFVVDITSPGITDAERLLARLVRQSGKPVILALNQADKKHGDTAHFRALGFESSLEVSAHHATGIDDLKTHLLELAPVRDESPQHTPNQWRVAFLGRPNVGKSSLLNAFTHANSAIVSAEAGTTRDPVSATITHNDTQLLLTDTAGMRRPGKIGRDIEYFSLTRTKQVIAQADICVLVLDATDPATAMDQRIAGMIREAGKGLVIAVNKSDAVTEEDERRGRLDKRLTRDLEFVWWAPYVLVSATTGLNLDVLLDQICEVGNRLTQKLLTRELNKILTQATVSRPPASSGLLRPKLNYITQTSSNPIEFSLFGTHPDAIHFSYRRYLENQLREHIDLRGVPIKLIFKSKYKPSGDE